MTRAAPPGSAGVAAGVCTGTALGGVAATRGLARLGRAAGAGAVVAGVICAGAGAGTAVVGVVCEGAVVPALGPAGAVVLAAAAGGAPTVAVAAAGEFGATSAGAMPAFCCSVIEPGSGSGTALLTSTCAV